MKGSVLVIGAGISGMRATAELVQEGFKVFLLEQRPTIGGTMAQLDKMYPTNECATCTLLPKMLELTSNENVTLLAFSELKEVTGADGGFKVRLEKKVRYVDPTKCNACTECFPVCPVGAVPMEFNFGRGASKAIRFWSPFPPRKALIDPEACTYIREGKCGEGTEPLCAEACEPDAIDFSQKPAEVEIEVGSIILAAGAKEERGEPLARLGHGRLDNVLTSLEYERLLSGLGPTGGVVKRDDETVPHRVAWIVTEDFDSGGRPRSPTAFMSATSEALGTLERDAGAEAIVISGGPKLEGRGYEAFWNDARERGVQFTTASAAEVTQGPDGALVVSCQGGDRDEIEADMVVLSPPLVASKSMTDLAERLGIGLDDHGLPATPDAHPLKTTRKGVYLCGIAQGSKGIRESVIDACAAAAASAARLAGVRGTEITSPSPPELLPVTADDEAKTAVMICRCGANIAGVLDIQELADYVGTLPHVARVEITPFGCDGVKIKELLGSGEYNRLLVGACSPRTHEPLFQMYTEAGGLNRYLIEIVNLRNQCTWVHAHDKEGVARKARTLMRMGAARVALQEPLTGLSIPVTQSCLVIGGTPAGIACAAELGEMGYATYLAIAEDEPGAGLDANATRLLAPHLESMRESGNVTVYPRATIGQVQGFVGNYTAEVVTEGGSNQVEVGTIVIATRDKMGRPGGEEDYEHALYLTRDDDGFFVGALGNLNPLDFNTDGVFMCGSARDDTSAAWSMVSGEAAASRAAAIISHGEMAESPVVSCVVDENCDGCAYCIEPCPAHAITLIEYMKGKEIKKTVEANEALCKGCGSCMATCPKEGIFVHHFRPDHLRAMVDALLEVA
ncbi:hypothetical protein AMJ71_09755 [candidate division TA06 bacterium SM1_40]|uniref:4Fe-4S ferredoxin-type domain-containing protein n=2 Tax=Bacteria division TA06 TaxID=1156500 RepID=A0A0S8JAR1_UNCT6|nr:MAG: hypothetical protein AMJ82_02880 [candidate division TA06 bacterium SM23_40]KPL06418.1 MAG: hypothetical protein AMJ71_09755 [candidate division TA06 bacterium SM1_40]